MESNKIFMKVRTSIRTYEMPSRKSATASSIVWGSLVTMIKCLTFLVGFVL